jgi:hypothetical protein
MPESGLPALDQKIARFEELLEEMKETTREAHSVLKQLRIERKDIEKALSSAEIKAMVDARVETIVKSELDRIGPELKQQTSKIYARVQREVDKLIDISLGKEFSSVHGREDLRPELAAKLKEWLTEIIAKGR